MRKNRSLKYTIITNRAQLATYVQQLQKYKHIGVDLEADSLYHFREKVCLVQIAAANLNIVIDPLQIKDLTALKPLFNNRDIQKVFHGADYDIRSLYRDFKITVNNLFDTQLGCRFLGMNETSLEAVIRRWFKVSLNKKYQRKDWSKRPLPEEMIAPDRRLWLDLGEVQVMAEVELNGRSLGTLWKPPFRVEVTGSVRPGENSLEVKVVNLWVNRQIGDEHLPEDSDRHSRGYLNEWPQWLKDGEPSPTGRHTFTTWRLWGKDDALLESGLLGPVRILTSVRKKIVLGSN